MLHILSFALDKAETELLELGTGYGKLWYALRCNDGSKDYWTIIILPGI